MYDILKKLTQNASGVAERILRERQALLEGVPDEYNKGRKKGRRKSTMSDGVIRPSATSSMAGAPRPQSPSSADKVELDYFLFAIIQGYSFFKQKRMDTLIQLFNEQRIKEAKYAKKKMLKKRKKKKQEAEGTMATAATAKEEEKIVAEKEEKKTIEVTLDFDNAKRELQVEEDTIDAIELGLLPWCDCLKMIKYVKDMTEKMSDEEDEKRKKGLIDPRISKIMVEMNVLANDKLYWNALIKNGVHKEAKKRALEKEIRDHKQNNKQSKDGEDMMEWKSFTEDDIDMLISTRKVSPGIDSKTFIEIVMFNKIGWYGKVTA